MQAQVFAKTGGGRRVRDASQEHGLLWLRLDGSIELK
jgi:hypothetical protein